MSLEDGRSTRSCNSWSSNVSLDGEQHLIGPLAYYELSLKQVVQYLQLCQLPMLFYRFSPPKTTISNGLGHGVVATRSQPNAIGGEITQQQTTGLWPCDCDHAMDQWMIRILVMLPKWIRECKFLPLVRIEMIESDRDSHNGLYIHIYTHIYTRIYIYIHIYT